jgi:hypothetical protein
MERGVYAASAWNKQYRVGMGFHFGYRALKRHEAMTIQFMKWLIPTTPRFWGKHNIIPRWIMPLISDHPKTCQSLTLSPGERAGVRASVNPT